MQLSKKENLITNFIVSIGSIAAAFLMYKVYTMKLPEVTSKNESDKNKERLIHVKSNLESFIELQEKRFRIKHYKIPEVRIGIPKNSLDYSYTKYRTRPIAIYQPTTNTMYITEDSLDINLLNEAIHHELGHSYSDGASERLGRGDWPNYYHNTHLSLSINIISEGIAEYIAAEMTSKKDKFTDLKYPRRLSGFYRIDGTLKNPLLKEGGRHLVKPIIERYGEFGIEYLMFNPPTTEELVNLPRYRERMLRNLDYRAKRMSSN